jgi:hypothetical protein
VQIKIDTSAWKQTGWHEYALRFLFGGTVTRLAGIIAKQYGPVVGGVFLAFPAIFPASVTLIQKHEEQKKTQHGLKGERRARQVASVEAAGTAMGSAGLVMFGVLVWQMMPKYGAALVIASATLCWAVVALGMWLAHKRI